MRKESEYQLWIIWDDTHRITQSMEVAKRLGGRAMVLSVAEVAESGGLKSYLDVARRKGVDVCQPDVVIGAGKGAASLVRQVKETEGDGVIAVQLQDPGETYDAYDLIAIPETDPYPDMPNILPILGLPNFVCETMLEEERQKLQAGTYPRLLKVKLPRPRLAVLLGGASIAGDITPEHAETLCDWLQTWQREIGGSVLLTTSQRTSAVTTRMLQARLTEPCFFYNFKADRDMPNPYRAMLALADGIIVTGDSVRMVSEACSVGVPVGIYQPGERFCPYTSLHSLCVERGYAVVLKDGVQDLSCFPPKLDETGRIAERVRALLQARR